MNEIDKLKWWESAQHVRCRDIFASIFVLTVFFLSGCVFVCWCTPNSFSERFHNGWIMMFSSALGWAAVVSIQRSVGDDKSGRSEKEDRF